MKPLSLKELLCGVASVGVDGTVRSVVTDSRKAGEGSVFVAIRGERTDGHDHAASTLAQGALCVVAEHPIAGVPAERTALVDSSLDAMIAMSANYRARFSPMLIGITGSVGKTTTKEFCAAVFSEFGVTLKTEGNQNNELGVPNTLFCLDEDVEYAVVEMGMDKIGDLHKLTLAAKPAAAIITRIGVSHIEHLGSRENILKAKMEICDGIAPGGALIVNGDDDLLSRTMAPRGLRKIAFGIDDRFAQVIACDIISSTQGEHFTIRDKQNGDFAAFIPTVGRHNIYNALAAYTLATRQGLDPARVVAALETYETTGLRQHVVEKNGMLIIEDCYNANPDSMRAGLEALAVLAQARGGKRVAVLGDMLELGEISDAAHRQAGQYAARSGVELLITVGK
ncbi:MAG: UDP-N-acetylmuramoyl-tripeptide--D-alanyl-D-alanine ligase, partial [Pygmaiobacter sp.]